MGCTITHDQSVPFSPRGRLAPVGQFPNDLLGNRMVAALVLPNQLVKGRFDVDQFDARIVVGKEVDPSTTSLPQDTSSIESE